MSTYHPPNFKEIQERPTVIDHKHESLYRVYYILKAVQYWLSEEVPTKVILQLVEQLDRYPGLEAEWSGVTGGLELIDTNDIK